MRTDGRADMTKLIVAFRKFCYSISQACFSCVLDTHPEVGPLTSGHTYCTALWLCGPTHTPLFAVCCREGTFSKTQRGFHSHQSNTFKTRI